MATLPLVYRDDNRIKVNCDIIQSENPYRREELKIKTSFGLMVRSKSEAVIAEMLNATRIKWQYEKALILDCKAGLEDNIKKLFTLILR